MSSCQKKEEVTVTQYFQAMEADDRDTMSTMAYEPKDIVFKSYEILSIDEPEENDLALAGLLKKKAELEAQQKDLGNEYLDKADELAEAEYDLEETRRRSTRAKLRKQIEELTTEVDTLKESIKTLQKEINENKNAINREKDLITLNTGMQTDLEMFGGKTYITKVTVKVTLENDEVQDYIFLLRRDTLTLQDRETKGRLIIVTLMTADEYEQEMKAKEETPAPPEEVTEEEPATEEGTTEETG
jgi:predicted RNase H-like nuclease (RuvC/YqgF family)